jgi:hypothetical protein
MSSETAASISTYALTPIHASYSSAFSHHQLEYLPQAMDPNSPDVFKRNVQLVQQHVARVNSLARSALNGMLVVLASFSIEKLTRPIIYRENAYHYGNSPSQTEGAFALQFCFSLLILYAEDITALKQNLLVLSDLMRQTGVGALPLLPMPSDPSQPAPVIPTEEMMLTDTSRSVQVLYDRLKRTQESATVVANLLSAPDHGGMKSGK